MYDLLYVNTYYCMYCTICTIYQICFKKMNTINLFHIFGELLWPCERIYCIYGLTMNWDKEYFKAKHLIEVNNDKMTVQQVVFILVLLLMITFKIRRSDFYCLSTIHILNISCSKKCHWQQISVIFFGKYNIS